jgi:hypothetical protein
MEENLTCEILLTECLSLLQKPVRGNEKEIEIFLEKYGKFLDKQEKARLLEQSIH